MTKLSVNINKVALIRNARGEDNPNILQFARDCEEYGAQGITVHPRPDERHIRFEDLAPLKEIVQTEFNIEGYPSDRFVKAVCNVKPHQVTLVPDPPGALTSSEGWDTEKHNVFLKEVISEFNLYNIRVSIFFEADPRRVESAAATNADRIELYTGPFAKQFHSNKEESINNHIETAKEAKRCNLGLNAGHDLNLDNLNYYVTQVPNLLEVSIGHALICDALKFGIQNVIQMYLHQINKRED